VINLVLRLLRDEYPQYAVGGQLHVLEGSVASAALVGSIMGQIVAGSMADIVGRKKIFVITAALIAIGSIGSACALDTPFLTIYGQISCWRLFLGAGVGGEYPLAATVTSESSSAGKRGSLMCAVFAMQGVGSLLSGVVVFCCLSLGFSLAFTWRFALAFGAIPAILAFPWRLRMHETESFERLKKERMHDALLVPDNVNNGGNASSSLIAGGTGGGGYREKNPITYQIIGSENAGNLEIIDDDLFPLYEKDEKKDDEGAIEKEKGGEGSPSLSTSSHHHPHPLSSEGKMNSNDTDDTNVSYIIEQELQQQQQQQLGHASNISPLGLPPLHTVTPSKNHPPKVSPPAGADSSHLMIATESTPLFHQHTNAFNGRKRVDSDDYGQHLEINSRNNSNTDYLYAHLNRDNSANYGALLMADGGAGRGAVGISPPSTVTTVGSGTPAAAAGGGKGEGKNGKGKGNIFSPDISQPGHSQDGKVERFSGKQPNPEGERGGGMLDKNTIPMSAETRYVQLISEPLHKDRYTELKKAFKYYRFHILGTALCWFLLDIDFYANGLFNHEITSSILATSNAETGSPLTLIAFFLYLVRVLLLVLISGVRTSTSPRQDAINSMILSCISIPGYLLSVFFIERVGRKSIQMMGFTVMCGLFLICGLAYDSLLGENSGMAGKYLFLLIYSLTFLFRLLSLPLLLCCVLFQ
jgi:hypothetical protein